MSESTPPEEKIGHFHSIPEPTGESQKEALIRSADIVYSMLSDFKSQITTVLEDQCPETIYLVETGVGENRAFLRVHLRHEEDMVKADADKTLH